MFHWTKPEQSTKIEGLLSMLPRQAPQKPLGSTIPPNRGDRGVYHRIGVDGGITFEIVDSSGATRFEVKPSARDCGQRTLRWCERVLDAIDPLQKRPRLSMVNPSPPLPHRPSPLGS